MHLKEGRTRGPVGRDLTKTAVDCSGLQYIAVFGKPSPAESVYSLQSTPTDNWQLASGKW